MSEPKAQTKPHPFRRQRCGTEHVIDAPVGRLTYRCVRFVGHDGPHKDWYGNEYETPKAEGR